MPTLIADASALVSLGIVADEDPDPLALCRARYEIVVPTTVVEELREIASYDDSHGRAASIVLSSTDALKTQSVALDAKFPLDDGENRTRQSHSQTILMPISSSVMNSPNLA